MTKKVALITGAGQGIGEAIAKRLSHDGYSVSLVGRTKSKVDRVANEINQDNGDAIAIKADVSDREQVYTAVEQTVQQFGDLNVMINNAAIGPTTPIEKVEPAEFDKVYQTNVGGMLWGIQAAYKKFKQLEHSGKIINATSQLGTKAAPELPIYSSTKFAIRGLTQAAAQAFGKDNITVNAFAPGVVKTPMMFNQYKEGMGVDTVDEKDIENLVSEGIALKRLQTAAEVADGVAFLVGADSNYMTGQTLEIDGGIVFH